MAIGKWIELYNDGGTFKEMRHVGKRRYQVIEVLDMEEYCGRDNEGHPRFSGELSLIDFDEIPAAEIARAKESCGWQDMPQTDEALVECVSSYGIKAPLDSCGYNSEKKCKREMRHEAMELARDSCALESALGKSVNAIGTTAKEFMQGNVMGGLQRSVEAGEPNARLMAKMYGVDQYVIDDVRPDDWLPYMMGYMAAMGSNPPEKNDTENPIAPEYFRGYKRGERVRKGECPAPGWIKTQTTNINGHDVVSAVVKQ